MKNIKLIKIDKLVCHEKINKKRLDKLLVRIQKDQKLRKPIVVDEKTLMILDGHHRYSVFKELGYKKIPCLLVNYLDSGVKLSFRRKYIKDKILKEAVLNMVKNKKLFPYKTTKHILSKRPVINIPLNSL